MKKKSSICTMPCLFTVNLGSKGQIVIPKEARDSLHIEAGDRLVLVTMHDHLMVMPADNMQHFIQLMQEQLQNNQKQ